MSAAAGKGGTFGMMAVSDPRNTVNTNDGNVVTREFNEDVEIDNPQAPPTRKKVGTPYKMTGHTLPGIKQRKK